MPIVTGPRRGSLAKVLLGVVGVIGVLLAIGLGVVLIITGGGGVIASPAGMVGGPIRVAGPAGDRAYLLTTQWRTYRPSPGTSRSSYTDLLTDVWAFDARDAKPVWRRRLSSDRRGVNMGRAVLGVQNEVLWILTPTGLIGLSLKDGAPVADVAAIEAANPPLRGVIPSEQRYYRFDGQGLAFTAADGRDWRMTGEGLKAVVAPRVTQNRRDKPAPAAPRVTVPAYTAGGSGAYAFQARSLQLQKRWLGLLADAEVESFRKNQAIGGTDPESHPRSRLWWADRGSVREFLGPRATYSGFTPLPEGPEFLYGGLLTDGRSSVPIMLFKPDGLLVLHRDKLGDGGRWRLTRVSGPNGKVAWTADLPLNAIDSVMPGEGSVLMHGYRDEEPTRRDRRPDPTPQLVAVDLATGRMGVYGFKVKATKPEDIPPSSTPSPIEPAPAAK
ncbi:PA2928 family protein [Phenylobacterium sp.]|uniref:PA2928 family protein n=1 Tax=Phenylobacterium sp. TaxID=1871053 RepID=UPI002735A5E8|nr:PA2928 family protein [Phenylobacterium sp.]MDP3659070.1 PA2928 family protein [Phenylobacterium sp.]